MAIRIFMAKKETLWAILFLLVAASPRAAVGEKGGYVQVDVANVRAEPRADSEIVAKLRINTRVVPERKQGDWAYVEWIHNETQYPIRISGWILRDLLGKNPLTLKTVIQKAEQARNPHDRMRWRERAVAIDPRRKESWESLRRACLDAGSEKLSLRTGRVLASKEPVYIAVCDGNPGSAFLAGVLEPTGKFRVLVQRTEDHAKRTRRQDPSLPKELSRLRLELAGIPWFSIVNGNSYVLQGSPFARPRIAREESAGGDTAKLILGVCGDGHALHHTFGFFTSQPVAFVPLTGGVDPKRLPGMVSSLRSTVARASTAEPGQCAVPARMKLRKVDVAMIPGTSIRDASVAWQDDRGAYAVARGLFDRQDRLLWPTGKWRAKKTGGIWFRPMFGSETVRMTLSRFTDAACGAHGGIDGVCLHVVGENGKLETQCIITDLWGC